MSRIEAEHLARGAIVYVRQSTADQVNTNVESRRRQYGLVERARQLGWTEVSVIDDDLGRSGSGSQPPGVRKAPGCDLRRPGRRSRFDRGFATGPQRARLAHALGVLRLWSGR